MTAFRWGFPALLIAFCALAPPAYSRELFDEEKPPTLTAGQAIQIDDTIGNYQIYAGNGAWQFERASIGWSGGRADSIPMGLLQMVRWEGAQIVAAQTIVANIRSNNGAYWSGAPCDGEHLAKRNRARGRYDDCMHIDVTSVTVGSRPETFLRVSTVQSNTAGRYYEATMLISAAYLGFPGSSTADWDGLAVKADTAKTQALARLNSWAELYQDAAAAQMNYRKPADAFAAVPKLKELRPVEAPMIQIVKDRSAAYVFCESSKRMVMEGTDDCLKPKR